MVVGLVLNLAACEAAVALRAADRGVLLASVAPCQHWIDALPAEDAAKHRASLLRYFFQAASAAAARAPSEGGHPIRQPFETAYIRWAPSSSCWKKTA